MNTSFNSPAHEWSDLCPAHEWRSRVWTKEIETFKEQLADVKHYYYLGIN